ncbi:MAG TPA: hypothetical protein VHB73_08105 [Alphaproteobacteria bacterium]|nr:hypothetical protein [Alphaproteobacteria bacterium]
MSLRDLKSSLSVSQSLVPAARAATGTGTAVDLQGYGSAMVVVSFGAWTDGTHTPSLQHSADGTAYTACDTNSLAGSFTAVSGTAGSNTVQKVGYIGQNRYVRALMTVASGTTGALSSVNVVAGHPSQRPTT